MLPVKLATRRMLEPQVPSLPRRAADVPRRHRVMKQVAHSQPQAARTVFRLTNSVASCSALTDSGQHTTGRQVFSTPPLRHPSSAPMVLLLTHSRHRAQSRAQQLRQGSTTKTGSPLQPLWSAVMARQWCAQRILTALVEESRAMRRSAPQLETHGPHSTQSVATRLVLFKARLRALVLLRTLRRHQTVG